MYDFSKYDKIRRYDEITINNVRELLTIGYSTNEIINELNLENSSRIKTFISRQRKYLKDGNNGF